MDRARLLEYIASALHRQAGLDNQSTTTAAFCDLNNTLYLTSKENKHYQDLLSVAFAKLRLLQPTEPMGNPRKLLILLRNPTDQQAIADNPSVKKRAFSDELKEVLKFRISRFDDDQERLDFEAFMNEIISIKVVLDGDLYIQSEHHSGFHGESRIVRFLYIKYLKRVPFDELANPSQKTIDQFNTEFSNRYSKRLWMGSSQGACNYCASMMKALGVEFRSTQDFAKDRNETWRHPLTTTTGKFPKPTALGLMATVAVSRSGHKGPNVIGNSNMIPADNSKME